jgi:hypothetical protein
MTQTLFSLEETRDRRAHAVVQAELLLHTHESIEHGSLPTTRCPKCIGYRHDISLLSIPAEKLPRFNELSVDCQND